MTSYRFFVLCLLLAMMPVLTAERSVYAQSVVPGEPVYHWIEYIREPGMLPDTFDHYAVIVSKPTVVGITPELGRHFHNYQNCGDLAHKTQYDSRGYLNSTCTSRYFDRIEVSCPNLDSGISYTFGESRSPLRIIYG
jgi:hypothetical protein